MLTASLFPSARAVAQEGEAFFMPAPEEFDAWRATMDAVAVDSSARARTCEWDGAWRCECVVTPTLRAGLVANDELRNVILTTDDANVWVERYDRTTGAIELGVVESSGRWTTFARAEEAEGRWSVADVALSNRAMGHESVSDCEWSPPEIDPEATAESATETDSGWRLSGYEAGGVPVGEVEPGKTESGLLPPTVRANGDAVELEASTYVAPIGGPTVTAAPGRWYGGGLKLMSDGALDLQGRWDVEEGFVPFAWGAAGRGDARQRVDASLEHPAPESHAALRRIESGAFLRPWRRSAAGVNLSGPTYGLTLEGGWVSRLDGETDGDLVANFAGASRPSEFVRLDFDLGQYSRTVDDASSHSTTAAIRIAVPTGQPTTAWLTPSLGIFANYGVIPAQLGFEASASAGVFAEVSTGASWTGRFERARHVISPRLRFGRELVGISQRAPLPADAPSYLFTRTPEFTWLVAELENRLELSATHIAVPVGVLAAGAGLDTIASPRPYIRPSLALGAFRTTLGATCTEECGGLGWFIDSSLRFDAFDVRATVSRASIRDLRIVAGESAFESPIHAVAVSQVVSDQREPVGRLGAGMRIGSIRLDARAAATPDAFVGGEGGVTWELEPLGFGVGLLGGWRTDDGAWTAQVGLQMLR